MASNMPLLLKRSLLSVWSISHPHEYFPICWLTKYLLLQNLYCNYLVFVRKCPTLFWCFRNLSIHPQSVLIVFLQGQTCFKCFALSIILCFLEQRMIFDTSNFCINCFDNESKVLIQHHLLYLSFILTYAWKPLVIAKIKHWDVTKDSGVD